MAAIRSEVATPSPLPFPWRRAWPGIIAIVITVGALFVAIVDAWHAPATFSDAPWWVPDVTRLTVAATAPSVVWGVAGIVLALAAVTIGGRLGYSRQKS